jgi:hypothetical protein
VRDVLVSLITTVSVVLVLVVVSMLTLHEVRSYIRGGEREVAYSPGDASLQPANQEPR